VALARKRKGPRPKRIPQRMCIACRAHDTKRGLYRIVRTPEGAVEPDPTGRRNGRGAYLCGQIACWEKALSSGILARALNIDIDTESLDALRRYAATLPLETPEGPLPPVGGDSSLRRREAREGDRWEGAPAGATKHEGGND
jgi:predicted RNA-binding protein YlxR (DUF448 family)